MDASLNTLIQLDQQGSRLVFGSGSVEVNETGAKRLTTSSIGSSTLGTMSTVPGAVNVVEEQMGLIHRTVITLTNYALAITDNGVNGAQGSVAIYAFPRGLIDFLGSILNLTLTGDGTNQTATAAVVTALGTVAAAADATLTSTEANLAPSVASTFTASAGVCKSKGVTSAFFDNTTTTNSTNMPAIFNVAIPDAGSSANGTITVSGTITLWWIHLGDN